MPCRWTPIRRLVLYYMRNILNFWISSCRVRNEQPKTINLNRRTIRAEKREIPSTPLPNRIPIDPPTKLGTVVSVARSDTCAPRARTTRCAPRLPRPRRGLRSQVVAHDGGMMDRAGGAVKRESAGKCPGRRREYRLAVPRDTGRGAHQVSCRHLRASPSGSGNIEYLHIKHAVDPELSETNALERRDGSLQCVNTELDVHVDVCR